MDYTVVYMHAVCITSASVWYIMKYDWIHECMFVRILISVCVWPVTRVVCVSCYVRIDAGACIDYTCIVQFAPCRALCLDLKFVFTVSMYVHYIRNQCEV